MYRPKPHLLHSEQSDLEQTPRVLRARQDNFLPVLSVALSPYVPTESKPWNKERVIHLYRRLGMGPTAAEIREGLAMTPSQLVDMLIDRVLTSPPPTRPYWADYPDTQFGDDEYYEARDTVRYQWISDMVQSGIKSKLVLFWHNHFVTELDVYGCNKYMWSYYELLSNYCLGNFKRFVEEMGLNPAMLIYLNGNRNSAGNPNENYARELMELFTMGESNGYTQADIPEVAKALTGYRANQGTCQTPFFSNNHHDRGPKTIFGKTANYDYAGVHNLIFTERANEVGHYISEKVFKHFVYPEVDQQVVDGLAASFIESQWDLSVLFRTLFKSEAFFDAKYIGALISSPLEIMVKWTRAIGLDWTAVEARRTMYRWGPYDQGMDVFNPVNVAGWPGHRNWINESTFTLRIKDLLGINLLVNNADSKTRLVEWAQSIVTDPSDPEEITREIARELMGTYLDEAILGRAIAVFKADIPENYYEDGSWNLYWNSAGDQIFGLLNYLVRIPEAQLA